MITISLKRYDLPATFQRSGFPMSFIVSATKQTVSVYNRLGSYDEAVLLANVRRAQGAADIKVLPRERALAVTKSDDERSLQATDGAPQAGKVRIFRR